VAEPSVRAALCCHLANATDLLMPVLCGSIFNGSKLRSYFSTFVDHQITSADAGEIVVCNAVFRLSIACSVPEIFAIEVRNRPKTRPNFLGGGPQILDLVFFKIAPISDHEAYFRGDRPRDGDLALNKKRKKGLTIGLTILYYSVLIILISLCTMANET